MRQTTPARIPGSTKAVVIAQLQQKLTEQAEQLLRKDRALAIAEMKIRVLEERLRLERIARYGKHSERLSDLQLQLLELEPGVSSEEIEAESERSPLTPKTSKDKGKTKAKNEDHPGRNKLPAHLKREEQIIACTAEQCVCGKCGGPNTVIGYEESEVLDVKPAEYFVTVIKREKRACARCEQQGVATAPAPERIVPRSILSDRMIIDLTVNKYTMSLPLYRQVARIEREADVEVPISTADDGVLRVGELLIPIVNAMKRELLGGSYLQADETPVGVQTHDKRGRNHQAYLWQYSSPGKGVVFDFQMGRSSAGPKEFLGQYEGLLQTDGYKAYDKVGGPKILRACCFAHARRKFVEAVKADATDAGSARVVTLMDELFAIDREARDKKMNHAERHGLRLERAPTLLEQMRTEMIAMQKTALPRSSAARAANYTLSLWSRLTVFLQHPQLEMSTNFAENSMRPIAMGRKNWLHLGSEKAGPKIAAIFSVIESCRRLEIPVRQYLADILPGLADRSIQSLGQLTPAAYKAVVEAASE